MLAFYQVWVPTWHTIARIGVRMVGVVMARKSNKTFRRTRTIVVLSEERLNLSCTARIKIVLIRVRSLSKHLVAFDCCGHTRCLHLSLCLCCAPVVAAIASTTCTTRLDSCTLPCNAITAASVDGGPLLWVRVGVIADGVEGDRQSKDPLLTSNTPLCAGWWDCSTRSV